MNTRTDHLVLFGTRFEEVAGLIEEANLYGTSPKLEERYARLRAWLLLHYRSVREVLRPLMPLEETGAEKMLWLGASTDSFERLMSCSTLERVVGQPQDVMVGRLKGVRSALSLAMGDAVAV